MKIDSLVPEFVEFIPEQMEHGKLYISEKYQVANHLCACGCGIQTVTPLNNNKLGTYKKGWDISINRRGYILNLAGEFNFISAGKNLVTLRPSIGNINICPNKSHYYITDNKIEWL